MRLLEVSDLFIIGGTLLVTLMTVGIIAFLFLFKQRHWRYLHEKQQLQSQFQQELLRTQLEIQEQTLKNISQEIHDNIGQVLSLAKLNLNRMDIAKPNDLETKINDSKKLVSKAIQDLRDLSKSLNTDNIASLGLIRSIDYELEMIRKTGSHQTSLTTEGSVTRLDDQKELILFRIVQEVLNNVLKHAEANKIDVLACYGPHQLELMVSDDGNGFDQDAINGNEHYHGLGIRNMQNRAKLIGAEFHIESKIGDGTKIKLTVPFLN